MTAWRNEPSPHITYRDHHSSRPDAPGDNPAGATMAGRIDAIMTKVLGAIEALADDLQSQRKAASEAAPDNPLPLADARRRLAHMLRLPRICARAACQRRGACRGDPLHCLGAALPLLPKDIVSALKLGGRKTRRGRAR